MQHKSFRKQVAQVQQKEVSGVVYTEDEALNKVRNHIEEYLKEEKKKGGGPPQAELADRNALFLKKSKAYYFDLIMKILKDMELNIEGHMTTENFAQMATAEYVGYSVLEDAFSDPKVNDIFVVSWDCIFVEKNGQTPEKYPKQFKSPKHLKDTIDRLLREGAEKQINNGADKIVDAEIFGNRYCITAPSVSPRGYSMTIRKHSPCAITLPEVLQAKVMNSKIANFLGTAMKGEANMIVGGITGSGKTTTLRALADFFISKLGKRIVCCEDTQELNLSNPNTLAMVTVKNDDPKIAVLLEKLILTALRLKPKYILVGEVRGSEMMAMIEAMQTGHCTLTTAHAETWVDVVGRAVTKYLMAMPSLSTEIVERIIGVALDYVIIQLDIPGVGRKIKSVTEISYDFEAGKIVGKPIFEYNHDTNDWDHINDVGEEKISKMRGRGVSLEEVQKYLKKKGE